MQQLIDKYRKKKKIGKFFCKFRISILQCFKEDINGFEEKQGPKNCLYIKII